MKINDTSDIDLYLMTETKKEIFTFSGLILALLFGLVFLAYLAFGK